MADVQGKLSVVNLYFRFLDNLWFCLCKREFVLELKIPSGVSCFCTFYLRRFTWITGDRTVDVVLTNKGT